MVRFEFINHHDQLYGNVFAQWCITNLSRLNKSSYSISNSSILLKSTLRFYPISDAFMHNGFVFANSKRISKLKYIYYVRWITQCMFSLNGGTGFLFAFQSQICCDDGNVWLQYKWSQGGLLNSMSSQFHCMDSECFAWPSWSRLLPWRRSRFILILQMFLW